MDLCTENISGRLSQEEYSVGDDSPYALLAHASLREGRPYYVRQPVQKLALGRLAVHEERGHFTGFLSPSDCSTTECTQPGTCLIFGISQHLDVVISLRCRGAVPDMPFGHWPERPRRPT